jgi:hypothetical protein
MRVPHLRAPGRLLAQAAPREGTTAPAGTVFTGGGPTIGPATQAPAIAPPPASGSQLPLPPVPQLPVPQLPADPVATVAPVIADLPPVPAVAAPAIPPLPAVSAPQVPALPALPQLPLP